MSTPARRTPSRTRAALAVLAFSLVLALALAASASAKNLFTLDANANSPGWIAMDSSANVYVGWFDKNSSSTVDGGNEIPMFCKFALGATCPNPVTLNLPGPTTGTTPLPGADDGVDAVLPVLGASGTVYLVGPRYDDEDTVLWTSTNGGGSFDSGIVIPNSYDSTGPDDALLDGSNLLLGANNVGLIFNATPLSGGGGADELAFDNVLPGGVANASLALDQNGNPVEAYGVLSTPSSAGYEYYNGPTPGNAAQLDDESNWMPETISGVSQVPALAGSPGGLYMLSADGSNPSNGDDPTVVDVRAYDASTHTFGAPVALTGGNPDLDFDLGGAIAVTPSGRAVALWPAANSSTDVLDAYTSTNGGATFSAPVDVATCSRCGVASPNIAAIDTSGGGVEGAVAFDDGGLQIADLTPLTTSAPPPSQAATNLTTLQTSGATSGASLTITAGTVGERDVAAITGTNAATAGGTVTYSLYDADTCTAGSQIFNGGTAGVKNGVATASSPVTSALGAGKYYWRASYSGDASNAASQSGCGSEVLTVVNAASLPGTATSNGTTVTISVSCQSATPCSVTVTLSVTESGSAITAKKGRKPKKKVVTLGTGHFTISAHKTGKLSVKLNRAGRSLLRKHHDHLDAKLAVGVATESGTRTITRTIDIKKAKVKRHTKHHR